MYSNKKNIFFGGSLVLLLMVSMSCQKLTESPKGSSAFENFYTTPAQCEAALTGSMNTLFNAWEGYINFHGIFPDGQYDGETLDYGADFDADVWKIHYKALLDINAVLKAVKLGKLNSSGPSAVKGITAQARFLRAFNYFTLVRLYGKIPYITEDTPDPIVSSLTPDSRLEIAAVYDKIEQDLIFAKDNLADYNPSVPARPNLWIAKSMLAKVYLTRATAPLNQTENYAKAMNMASDVIEHGPYSLLSNFRDVFKTSNKNNKEIIYAFQVTDDDPNIDGVALAPSEWGGWSGGPVKPSWAEAYPDQPRKYSYLLLSWHTDIEDPNSPIVDYPESEDGVPYIGKYNYPNLTIEEELGISRQYFPLMRFPDVLLMYAEAANMVNGGPTQLAVDRVNLIINRANEGVGLEPLATMAMTKEAFDKKVIDERNYELCFEFDRIFDVLRKRILKDVMLPDNAEGYEETDYLFPIPTFDATFIGNNPGY